MNETEHRHLKEQVAISGFPMEVYLRTLIAGEKMRPRPPNEYAELRRQLAAIGNNINQIARSVNAGIAKPEDARRGLYLLDQVYELMFQVANK